MVDLSVCAVKSHDLKCLDVVKTTVIYAFNVEMCIPGRGMSLWDGFNS